MTTTSPPEISRRLHLWRRCADVLLGVVLPIGMIGYLIHTGPHGPEWQSDDWLEFAGFLYQPSVFVYFAPLIALSLVSLALLALSPARGQSSKLIRIGVYTGALVSLPFCPPLAWLWVMLFALSWSFAIFAVCVVAIAYRVPRGRWRAAPYVAFAANAIASDVTLATINGHENWFSEFAGLQCFLILFTAPLLIAAPYLRQSWLLWFHHPLRWQFSLPGLMGLVTWLSTYAAAWRAAYMQALLEYSLLPTEPPDNCYIATAAARGHRVLVGSWTLHTPAGGPLHINRQLQRLKAAELALRAVSPRAHRLARHVYDRLGPPLARRLRSPWTADVAFVLLLPAQALAACALLITAPQAEKLVDRLYRDVPPRPPGMLDQRDLG